MALKRGMASFQGGLSKAVPLYTYTQIHSMIFIIASALTVDILKAEK